MAEFATAPYRIDFASHSAFVTAWIGRNVFSRRNLMRFVAFTGLTALLVYYNNTRRSSDGMMIVWAVIGVLTGAIVAGLLVFIVAPLVIWLWQLLGFVFGGQRRLEQSVKVVGEGVEKRRDGDAHITVWDNIHEVIETGPAILLFTGRNSAMIVPKAALASPADTAAFTETVIERSLRRPHPDPAKNF